jgi:hypothetical protein
VRRARVQNNALAPVPVDGNDAPYSAIGAHVPGRENRLICELARNGVSLTLCVPMDRSGALTEVRTPVSELE